MRATRFRCGICTPCANRKDESSPGRSWQRLVRLHTLSVFRNREQEEFFGDASLGQWIHAGVTIGMGTDSGTPLNFHRDALWREAKVFVDHGMPAARVISALTWVNARILGKEADLGTIEMGKLADITVIKGNPLFDIVALANVDFVIKDGVPYKDAKQFAVLQAPAAEIQPGR